jgi:hypothetical protein
VSTEALAFVVKALCDRLAARLEGRAMSAARLELLLTLDRALYQGFSHVSTLAVELPSPLAGAGDLLAVLRARLEHVSLPAPVLAATLRAPQLARAQPHNLDLLSSEPKAERALPRLVAEIGAELGPANVGTLALVDTWLPEQRTRLVPFDQTGHSKEAQSLKKGTACHARVTSALEPSRIVSPVRIEREEVASPRLLLRIQETQWWRGEGASEQRDLVAAWMDLRQGGGHVWAELRKGGALLRGWID